MTAIKKKTEEINAMLKPYIIPAILGAIHCGYILIAFFFQNKKIKEKLNKNDYSVEHIVCFKNESKFIKIKMDDCYNIDYFKIQHTFVNDNSTDNTLELLQKYKRTNTRIINNDFDIGKNQSQIKAASQSYADLLLFTDANVFLNKDSLKKLVEHFDENTVGACGNVTITTDMEHQDMSGKYWQLEKIIKRFQARMGSVIGFDGGFYCIRKKNYNLKRENELSDFESAFLIFEQQKQTGFADDAIAVELEKRKIKDSFRARIRASNRTFWSYGRIFQYIHKLNTTVLIHFTLHKLIRYLLIITFVLSLPFIIVDLYKISPLLLLVLLIPQILRGILESIALCIGGIIALTGKEYTTWSHKKV